MKDRVIYQQFQVLLAKARENEKKLIKFGHLEQQLMAARTVEQLLLILLQDFPNNFSLDAVTLVLFDYEKQWTFVLGEELIRYFSFMGLILACDAKFCESHYSQGISPVLTRFDAERHGLLFTPLQRPPCSVALLPLVRQGRLLGGLHLASDSLNRFSSNNGTYFLERMASFVVMCLENALYFEKLERSSWLDALTQVNNRRYFDVRLAEAVSHALRHKQALSLIMFDLDYFKHVNDKWGHQAGDLVLQQVARLIRSELRGSDSFARYGGEEFVAVLPETTVAFADEIAQRVRAAFAEFEFQIGQTMPIRMTVSMGVAQLQSASSQDEETSGRLFLGKADAALYKAKMQGRNCVVIAT
ncbi:MAG: sensor domain-containing diguanylate cyclase [Betaproteobacteria bacterium]|nr:sensor domain-containing diguanylate cyclase [Betaproteobacteria bacterium]